MNLLAGSKKMVSTRLSNREHIPNTLTVVKVGRIAMNLTSLVADERKRFKKTHNGASPTQIDCDIRIELSVGSFKGVLQVTAKAGTRKVVGDAQIEYVADPAWKGKYIEE